MRLAAFTSRWIAHTNPNSLSAAAEIETGPNAKRSEENSLMPFGILKSLPKGAAKATLGGTSRDLVPSNVQVLRNLAAGIGA
jgi:hypothetical protein